MKTFFILLLISPFFVSTAYAESIYQETADLAGVPALENALPKEGREMSGELQIDGSYDTEAALKRLWNKLCEAFVEQCRKSLSYIGQILALAIVCAAFSSLCQDSRIQEWIEIAACCSLSLLMIGSVEGMIRQATDTLASLTDYSHAAIPAIYSAAAFSGAVASAPVKYTAACLVMDVIISIQYRYILPLINAFLAVSVSRSMFDNGILTFVSRTVKWIITTGLTGITLAFTAYLSVTGLIAGSTDAVAVKAARTAISTALPVVGGILSDSASVLLAAAGVIKNSAGAFSLVAVCAMIIGPLAILLVHSLIFKFVAAVTETLPCMKFSRLIADFGTAFSMLLGVVGSCSIMLFLSIMSGIKVVS